MLFCDLTDSSGVVRLSDIGRYYIDDTNLSETGTGLINPYIAKY